MTTEALLAACRELRDLREQVRALRERDELLAADIAQELMRRKVESIDFAPDRRALLKRAARYTVDDRRLERVAAENHIAPDELAACRRSEWVKSKLRSLLGDEYDDVVIADYGDPVLTIVALTPETRSAAPVAE